jgi:hypothetical protein
MTCGSRLSASTGEGGRGVGWRRLAGPVGPARLRTRRARAGLPREREANCCGLLLPRVGLLRVGLEGRIGVDGLGIKGLGFEKRIHY